MRHRAKAVSSLWTGVPIAIALVCLFVYAPWPGKLVAVPPLLVVLGLLAGEILVIVTNTRELRSLSSRPDDDEQSRSGV